MPIAAAQRTAAKKGMSVFKGKRAAQFTPAANVPAAINRMRLSSKVAWYAKAFHAATPPQAMAKQASSVAPSASEIGSFAAKITGSSSSS